MLIQRIGAKAVLFWDMVVTSALCLLVPAAARSAWCPGRGTSYCATPSHSGPLSIESLGGDGPVKITPAPARSLAALLSVMGLAQGPLIPALQVGPPRGERTLGRAHSFA